MNIWLIILIIVVLVLVFGGWGFSSRGRLLSSPGQPALREQEASNK